MRSIIILSPRVLELVRLLFKANPRQHNHQEMISAIIGKFVLFKAYHVKMHMHIP